MKCMPQGDSNARLRDKSERQSCTKKGCKLPYRWSAKQAKVLRIHATQYHYEHATMHSITRTIIPACDIFKCATLQGSCYAYEHNETMYHSDCAKPAGLLMPFTVKGVSPSSILTAEKEGRSASSRSRGAPGVIMHMAGVSRPSSAAELRKRLAAVISTSGRLAAEDRLEKGGRQRHEQEV